jgi:Zn-dependent protease
MDLFSSPERIALAAIPMILAITLHEAAHGYVARMFGDSTAWMLGRVTLNPLKHIDPIGTVILPALMLLIGTGFLFGWAKPVPVNFGNLRHPKRDMLWVAAAGPAMNFLMALGWAIIFGVASSGGAVPSPGLQFMAYVGVLINISLMVLNLLPIPPLDGGRIAVSLLPHSLAMPFARLEPYGFFILLALLFTHVLERLMLPFVVIVGSIIEAVTGVSLPRF